MFELNTNKSRFLSVKPLSYLCSLCCINKNGNNKLASFTIMELLVVLVLISIVISSGALLYLQFNSYLNNNLHQTGSENNILLFTRALKQDINTPGNIIAGNSEIIINKKTGGQIIYNFDDNYIIRNIGETTDTFNISTRNLEILNDPVTSELREIKTDLISGDVTYPFLLFKEPENVDLFNKLPE